MTSTFRALHTAAELLILPNAWDAGSARLFESLGARAIATSSAGMAWALGYPDGGQVPLDAVVGVAAAIRRVVRCPISIDIEAGYSSDPREVSDLAVRLAELGVAGINLEDGADAPAVLAAKIAAIKTATAARGHDLFVNARTDVILAGLVETPRAVAEVLARGATYRDAGADGLFVPGLADPAQIRAVVAGVALPINVMAVRGLAVATELAALGVRRLSAGSGLAQHLWAEASAQAQHFLATGRSDSFNGAMPYGAIQKLWAR